MNHDMSRAAIENGPDIEEDDAEPGEVCEACDGWGWFTETRVDDHDRDIDIDHECNRCETTGRVL